MKIEVKKANAERGSISQITLTNASGASVTLSTHGAGIAAVHVPDMAGRIGNVIADYTATSADPIWDYEAISDDEVQFSRESLDDDGRKRILSYRWTEDNVLEIYLSGDACLSEQAGILGHSYINLDSNPDAFVEEYLWINSPEHPDFHSATRLCDRLVGNAPFAHRWCIMDWERDVMNDAALLASHQSGRQLSIYTSLPILRAKIPSSRTGISLSTLPSPNHAPLQGQQTTFLHFSLIR